MVKLKGPLFSPDATGKLSSDLQLSHWKGRNVIGRRRRPSQPRTEAQMAHRIVMGFLGSQWKHLTPQQRVTWEALATEDRTTPYNAYVKRNMARHAQMGSNFSDIRIHHATPTQTYPAAEELLHAYWSSLVLTGLPGALHYKWYVTEINQNWGLAIHHAWSPGLKSSPRTLIAMTQLTEAGWGEVTITGLKPGLWQTACLPFTVDGRSRQWFVNREAEVLPPT